MSELLKDAVSDIPVVILCGGRGTRIREETELIPKPMITVGGRPILVHLMQYYSWFGFRRFILCLGYKGEVIKSYFLNYRYLASSFEMQINGDDVVLDAPTDVPQWRVAFVDTGENAMTGARVKRIQPYVGDGTFMLTYGDGLADVDLHRLVSFHRSHGRLLTVTGVHPPSRFGLLTLEGTAVERFSEKTPVTGTYINGGFFVCEPGLFDYLEDNDSCTLEGDPLERVASVGQMQAYVHESYWQCMDTQRDREALEDAWVTTAPWRRR